MESDAELQRQDELAFEQSPDIQLPELRLELHRLGIDDDEIGETVEENDVPIFELSVSNSKFANIDKVALANLQLDSRYRFDLADGAQARALARFSGEEDNRRRKARYLRELADNGEMDRFPRYRAGLPMAPYARSLERYCGYEPGQALNVIDGDWLEYRNQMVDLAVERQRKGQPGMASFKCIVRIVYATDLQPHFIGNRPILGKIRT